MSKACRLRGVQVLGLGIPHDPAAETDDPAARVHDGEHDPVPEFIVHTVSLIHIHKPGFPKQFVGDTLLFQIKIQVVAVFVGIAKAKARIVSSERHLFFRYSMAWRPFSVRSW